MRPSWLWVTLPLVVVLCVTTRSGSATKLNYPRVLLPIFDHISVNFTLEVVEKGCFKWTSSRLDLIQIAPSYDDVEEDCSYRVVVTVINKEKRRNTAIVLAEDLVTGEVLRCDVILDVIDQLGVLTTTRELYLEEAPETFELWAQDSQGNAFTTLEGIEFHWQVASHRSGSGSTGGDSSWSQVLRFLSFSESKFHVVPRAIEKLELAGVQGYMVLLEGINTGSARVTAKLLHPEYAHVPPVDVNIMVLANLILNPSDVYILPGDTIEFKVLQLKQGKLHEIALNSQYYLEIEDETFASIGGNEAKGLKVGRTFVLLRDRNVPHDVNSAGDEANSKATLPKASLTVVDPKKLTINLLPHYNWITVEGESHEIALNLYTQDDHQITLGPRYKIQSTFDEALFYPLRVTGNGSSIFGETIATGSSPVTGKFEKLSAKAELVVFKRLAITPPEVILPYDPNLRRQKLQFSATGGDGSYSWSTQDANVVSISQTGLAEARLDQIKGGSAYDAADSGSDVAKVTQVRVAMARNVRVYVTAQVMFLPPIKLEAVRYNFETVLKDYVKLHVGLWAQLNGTLKPFTSCENLHFELEFSNPIFALESAPAASSEEPLASGACRVLYLRSTMVGQTTLKISYRYFDQLLTDQVNLNVFEKLAIENPIENEVVLPIGASRNLFYYNGPERIYNSEAELQRQLVYDRKALEVAEVSSGYAKDKHILRALCKKVGDFELKLQVYNTLNSPNVVPYVTEFVTKVFCVKPRFVNLITTDKVKTSCPLERRHSMMHVKTADESEQMTIDIEVLDVHNRKLANISSLLLEWKFFSMADPGGSALTAAASTVAVESVLSLTHTQQTEVDHLEGVEIPGRDFLLLQLPRELEASLKVKTIVTDYRAEVLKQHSIKPESPAFGVQKQSGTALVKPVIENELNFVSVNRTLLPYDRITIFLTTDTVERLKVAQGSGFYDIKASEAGIVAVRFDTTTRQLLISPRKVGEVKLEISDQCLSTEPSFLYVSVVTVGRVTILAADRVEKTKSIEAIARLYDNNDRLLEMKRDQLELYELRTEVFNSAVLSVALGTQGGNLGPGEVRYIVTGMELGETKFSVSAGSGKEMVTSAPATVQVFPPLVLLPRNATIVIGSTLQIHSKGGPTPDTNIVYSVQNLDVIDVESGVATGLKIGRSKVVGRCVGVNPTTGAQVVFSEDTIFIHVIPLDAIELKTPLKRIQVGATMPAHVWGLPGISPLVLGTVSGVKIRWSTDHLDVLDVRGVFQDIGVEYLEQDAIAVRVKALAPGKATLHVLVITADGQKLTAKTDVTVFRLLELVSPKALRYDSILIPPKSTIQLKANLDDAVYQLDSDTTLSNGGVVPAQVTRDGLVKSGETTGRVQVVASSQDQSLTIPVEVKNVHYIMATLHPGTVKLRQVDHSIPQGFALTLKVSLHDALGNEFSHGLEDVSTLRHRLSKRGNVLISTGGNYTVGLELIRETSDMLVVALRDQTRVKFGEDFIKLVVGEATTDAVFPGKHVFSVGDVVCFDSPLLGTEVRWSSSDEQRVKIDAKSGVAQILAASQGGTGGSGGPGGDDKVRIRHGLPRNGGISFAVDVLEADQIEFFKSYDIFNGQSYRGHLVIKNHAQVDKLTNVVALNVSTCQEQIERSFHGLFSCRLLAKQTGTGELLRHFKAYPSYDGTIGAYSCNIDLLTTIDDVANVIKSNEYNLELEVRLTIGGSGRSASSSALVDTSTLKVVPAVRIEPESIPVDQLAKQSITIAGLDKVLQKVEVTSSNPAALSVRQQQKQPGSLEYRLELLDSYRDEWADTLAVVVSSPLTMQTVRIPIHSPMVSARKCATQPFNSTPELLVSYVSNFGLLISAVTVLAATVWVFVFCYPYRQQPSFANGSVLSPFKNEHNLSSYDNRISSSPFASPLEKRGSNLQPSSPFVGGAGGGSPGHSFSGSQGNLSQDFNSSGASAGSPIYGDATIISPQKRVNRRYL